jgi:hypothetical protein
MDARLQALLNNSASMSKLLPDQKLVVQLWSNAQFFGQPTDNTSLFTYPQGLEEMTPDQLLNIELYAIANTLGLPTDGLLLNNRVVQSVGVGVPTSNLLPRLIQNAWFKNIKAY